MHIEIFVSSLLNFWKCIICNVIFYFQVQTSLQLLLSGSVTTGLTQAPILFATALLASWKKGSHCFCLATRRCPGPSSAFIWKHLLQASFPFAKRSCTRTKRCRQRDVHNSETSLREVLRRIMENATFSTTGNRLTSGMRQASAVRGAAPWWTRATPRCRDSLVGNFGGDIGKSFVIIYVKILLTFLASDLTLAKMIN